MKKRTSPTCMRYIDDPNLSEEQRIFWRGVHIDGIDARARAGDFRPLVEYLEHRGKLTGRLYDLLLAILRGEVKRKRGRQRDFEVVVQQCGIVIDYIILKRRKTPIESAVAEIAAKHGVSQRTVYSAIKRQADDIRDVLQTNPDFVAADY
jgi:hypothetical protein